MSDAATVLSRSRRDLLAGFARVGQLALFAGLPVVVVCAMFVVALRTGPFAWDFRNELYPQAESLLAGDNPYPEALWPPLAAVLAMPFTLLPSQAAGVLVALSGLACMALALWLVGVRDWRVYGVVGLWPPVLSDIRIAHLTPLLCLLAALVWRYRDRAAVAGLALGAAAALKFFLWPLGVWLLATRRREALAWAAGSAIVCTLPLLALAAPGDYVQSLRSASDRFDQDGYSILRLLVHLEAPTSVSRALTYGLGLLLLVLTWQTKRFSVAIAAALVLSPIVWLDFYALAAVPLALARPTLSAAWFLPLATWGLPSSGIAAEPFTGVGRTLFVFAALLALSTLEEPRPDKAVRL